MTRPTHFAHGYCVMHDADFVGLLGESVSWEPLDDSWMPPSWMPVSWSRCFQLDFAQWLEPHFHAPGPYSNGDGGEADAGHGRDGRDANYDEERLFPAALSLAISRPHVMSVTRERLVESVCSLLERGIGLVLEYNEGHPDFPLPPVSRELVPHPLSIRSVSNPPSFESGLLV